MTTRHRSTALMTELRRGEPGQANCATSGGCSGTTASAPGTIPNVNNAIPAASPAQSDSGAATADVTVHFQIPAATSPGISVFARHAQYISLSNASLKIVVTPQNGTPSTPVTGSCTTGTCSANFTAAIGANTVVLSLYDGALGTGNLLGLYTTTIIAEPNAVNTFIS